MLVFGALQGVRQHTSRDGGGPGECSAISGGAAAPAKLGIAAEIAPDVREVSSIAEMFELDGPVA